MILVTYTVAVVRTTDDVLEAGVDDGIKPPRNSWLKSRLISVHLDFIFR